MKATMIAFAAAVLLGLASTALATEPFGANTPVVRDKDASAHARAPVRSLRRDVAQASQPFTADEISRPE